MQKIIDSQRAFSVISSIDDRKSALVALRDAVLANEDAIYEAFKSDLNKSVQEVYLTEVAPILHEINYFLGRIKRLSRPRCVGTGLWLAFSSGRIVPQAHGSVLVIAPWNYPLHLSLVPVVGAIAAGNGVVLKPSFNTPKVAEVIQEICKSLENKQLYVVADRAEGYKVLDFEYDFIFFTGGAEFAKKLAVRAAENLTPTCLELGGKSPVVVDEGADVVLAAKRIAWGKTLNAGQTCVAPDYALVKRSLLEQFLRHLKPFLESFSSDLEQYVKIIDAESFNRLSQLVDNEADKLVYGGTKIESSMQIMPAVFCDVKHDSELMTREIFGPLLPIVLFDEIEEVVQIINAKDKPLALYYFGNSNASKRLQRVTDSGAFVVNDVVMHTVAMGMPFGGVGKSGMGSYHGKYSFDTFSHFKPILKQPLWFDLRARYKPYVKLETIKKIMR